MRLTIGKIALVCATFFLVVCACIRAFPLVFAYEQDILIFSKLQLMSKPGDHAIILMGDSRMTYGVAPKEIGEGVVSYAVPGLSTIEPYFLFKQYLSSHRPPKLVVYAISPNFFEHAGSFWTRVKAGLLTADNLTEIYARCGKLGDFPMITAAWPKIGFLYNKFSTADFPMPHVSRPGLNWRGVYLSLQEYPLNKVIQETNGFVPSTSVRDLRSRPLGEYGRGAFSVNFHASDCLDAYFDDFIELAVQSGTKVVFVQAPFSNLTLETISPVYREGFARYLASKVDRYRPNFFVGNDFSSVPNSQLADADHLNPVGARAFTARLKQELKPWLDAN